MTEIAFFLDDQTSHDFVELSSLLGEEEQVTHPCSDIESTIAVKDEMRQYETLPEFNFYHPIENAMKGVATIEGTTSPSEYMNGRLPLEPACVSPTPSTTIFDQTNHGSFPLLPDVNARANQEVCAKVVQKAANSSRKRKSQGYDDREEEQVGGHLKQKDRRRYVSCVSLSWFVGEWFAHFMD